VEECCEGGRNVTHRQSPGNRQHSVNLGARARTVTNDAASQHAGPLTSKLDAKAAGATRASCPIAPYTDSRSFTASPAHVGDGDGRLPVGHSMGGRGAKLTGRDSGAVPARAMGGGGWRRETGRPFEANNDARTGGVEWVRVHSGRPRHNNRIDMQSQH